MFCALLTYCWFGTSSGLGLQTVPLFVSTPRRMCASPKRHKGPLSSARPRHRAAGAVRGARVWEPRPDPALTMAACSPCSLGPCPGGVASRGLLGGQPAPVLKVAEPPMVLPAGVSLPSLEKRTWNSRGLGEL